MTIGIGALCHNGQCIIMASDMRGSYDVAYLSPHDRTGKQFDLPFGFCANIAGTVCVCQSVVSTLYSQMQTLENGGKEVYNDHIRNAIHESQFQELLYRVDHELTVTLGMRLTEWRNLNPKRGMYKQGRKIIKRAILSMELIVGGFLPNGAVLLEALYNEVPEMVCSHTTIGSGSVEALEALNIRQQNAQWSVQRSIIHISEALGAAKSANPKEVGDPSDYSVITAKWSRRLPADFASALAAKYSGEDTRELDDDFNTFKALQGALYETGISGQEYAAGKRLLSTPTPSTSRTLIQARSSCGAKYPQRDHFAFDD